MKNIIKNNQLTEVNLTKKEICEIDMPIKQDATGNDQILLTKPIFLNQISICKELNKLNDCQAEENTNLKNVTLDDSLITVNEGMLNDYLEENMLITDPKSSFDIQHDLFLQQENQMQDLTCNNKASNILINETNSSAVVQTSLVSDTFQFDEEFLNTFEANLNRFNSINNNSNDNIISTRTFKLYFI
jgi:hypothetical protein